MVKPYSFEHPTKAKRKNILPIGYNVAGIKPHVRYTAGAVVVKDITESGTYIGVPARKK